MKHIAGIPPPSLHGSTREGKKDNILKALNLIGNMIYNSFEKFNTMTDSGEPYLDVISKT